MKGSRLQRTLARLARHRWLLEVAFWLLFATVFWSLSTFAKIQEYQSSGRPVDLLAILTNETSSAISALLMLLFVRYWLDRYPVSRKPLPTTLAWHALGAVLFSIGHVLIFMLLRSSTYWALGLVYDHATGVGLVGVLRMFAYEFSQDLPLYAGMVIIIALYRHWLGSREAPSNTGSYPTTILASLGSREKVLKLDEVEWIQAAGNYASLHSKGQEYLLRSTMSRLEKVLDPALFQRVHRSYIVNINAVDLVLPAGSGQQLLRTRSGIEIPLGRSFRAQLLQRLTIPSD
ncbi:MAG TPA: LytTR family DNA-binding domain-containing protein [Xanthomonadales bacterium]|nr:LytTR family DNA-binding domain-containing protein [Xanthomonadales bacterium]